MKINIIGAGISGLALGYFCKKKGHDVRIFEASNKAGGIISTEFMPEGMVQHGPHLTRLNKTLEALGVSVEILYFHTFKPFDKDLVRKSVKKTKKLLTVENLSSADGLYSRCLDSCVNSFNFAVRQIAIRDFVLGYGTYEELCSRAKIGTIDIIKESKKLLKI